MIASRLPEIKCDTCSQIAVAKLELRGEFFYFCQDSWDDFKLEVNRI